MWTLPLVPCRPCEGCHQWGRLGPSGSLAEWVWLLGAARAVQGVDMCPSQLYIGGVGPSAGSEQHGSLWCRAQHPSQPGVQGNRSAAAALGTRMQSECTHVFNAQVCVALYGTYKIGRPKELCVPGLSGT
jgi:hypothetical protein